MGDMLHKLRMGQIKSIFGLLLFFFGVGGLLLWYTDFGAITALLGARPLTEKDQLSEQVGKYVSWEAVYPLDEYMETVKTKKVNGVEKESGKESSSWIVLDMDRGILMSVEVPYKRYDEMKSQAEAFYDAAGQDKGALSQGVKIKGSLELLDEEDQRYYNRAAGGVQKSYTDAADAVVYHISDGKIHGRKLSDIYPITALAAFLILMGVLLLVLEIRKSPKKKLQEFLTANPSVTMEELEQDFAAADREGNVYIGRRWTFCATLDNFILDNSQVIWVHTSYEQFRQTVTHYVCWEMFDGSTQRATQPDEKRSKAVMKKYSQFSHIVTGNSSEYSFLLKSDRDAFLKMKYQSAP